MLAKQGWRVLVSPNSLVSQIYKGKYFPRSDFLIANFGNNPNFVWRSIWQVRDIVKLGDKRIIGSGTTTSILSQPWLPDHSNVFVTTTHLGLHNKMIVHDMFNARDASLILGLSLCISAGDDYWSWIRESTGNFLLKIPPKVKNFMWRAVSNALPTCLQLVTRHVNISPTCPIFKSQPKSITHALISCSFAQACWHHAQPSVNATANTTVGMWLSNVFTASDMETNYRTLMLCWVASSALVTLDQWRKARDKQNLLSLALGTDGSKAEQWTEPGPNTIKINIDATLFEREGSYGFKIVARDSLVTLLDTFAVCNMGSFAAEVVEAIRVKEALSWIKTKG
ncbi:uncharacterized protein LOC133036086 [Cannabis sativa]|uniref:uncharacterized protein LOC133036086 n=1 Tax=Cannabis sativa TaxID=3483 RepID=UPI0029C9CA5F|nr:uncharacterized protein LOC133036086 [Cannabis sativa]